MERKFYSPNQETTHVLSAEQTTDTVLMLEDEGELTEALKIYLESN
ncbi:MAG: hypothetical protein JWO95_570, partial [Verrucomicrobiales bacterium]|nr:hypothetical protein [Verrucomicrobiales bacterium]